MHTGWHFLETQRSLSGGELFRHPILFLVVASADTCTGDFSPVAYFADAEVVVVNFAEQLVVDVELTGATDNGAEVLREALASETTLCGDVHMARANARIELDPLLDVVVADSLRLTDVVEDVGDGDLGGEQDVALVLDDLRSAITHLEDRRIGVVLAVDVDDLLGNPVVVSTDDNTIGVDEVL